MLTLFLDVERGNVKSTLEAFHTLSMEERCPRDGEERELAGSETGHSGGSESGSEDDLDSTDDGLEDWKYMNIQFLIISCSVLQFGEVSSEVSNDKIPFSDENNVYV